MGLNPGFLDPVDFIDRRKVCWVIHAQALPILAKDIIDDCRRSRDKCQIVLSLKTLWTISI